MTKHELLKAVSKRARVTQRDALRVLIAFTRTVSDRVAAGDLVRWKRFGTFYRKTIRARRIVAPPGSPNAGEPLTLPPQSHIGFRSARAQKRRSTR